jgi:hypothetical protein
MSKPTNLVQGTLDLLTLKTIALEPMHGCGIAQRIRQVSFVRVHIRSGGNRSKPPAAWIHRAGEAERGRQREHRRRHQLGQLASGVDAAQTKRRAGSRRPSGRSDRRSVATGGRPA